MLSVPLTVLVLALISGMSTLIGATMAIVFKGKNRPIVAGLGFAAGIMLCLSFFELLPETYLELGLSGTLASFLTGVILIVMLNRLIPHEHLCPEKDKISGRLLKTAYLCAFGLILHDFPEGFALANSYLHSPQLGWLMAVSIALHNIPEEFAIAIPIVLSRKGKKSLFKIAFVSGLAEPAGAVIGLITASFVPDLTPFFLGLSAGAMVFISLHELLPTASTFKRRKMIALGILLSLITYLSLTSLI